MYIVYVYFLGRVQNNQLGAFVSYDNRDANEESDTVERLAYP